MTVWILSDREQSDIARTFIMGFHTQEHLAYEYKVSTSTIRKVLKEKGLIGKKPEITVEQAKLLAMAEKYKLNDEKLEAALNAPALTYPNVLHYLKTLEQDRLFTLFSHTPLGEWLNKLPFKGASDAEGS